MQYLLNLDLKLNKKKEEVPGFIGWVFLVSRAGLSLTHLQRGVSSTIALGGV